MTKQETINNQIGAYRCYKFDSVTGELLSVKNYNSDQLKQAIRYARISPDNVSIRNSDNELLWINSKCQFVSYKPINLKGGEKR